MNLARYITEDLIRLEMTTTVEPWDETGSETKWRQEAKELVLAEIVDILDAGARIGNPSKLLTDYINRERKATTALGRGVAIPHIRSMQAKEFVMGFCRSFTGYEFDAPDDEPVQLFFFMAAPPYDDKLYLQVFKALSVHFHDATFRDDLFAAQSPGEIIRALRARD